MSEQAPSDPYFESLRLHRAILLQQRVDQINFFDKAVLTLSGGALGLSITFVDKFGGVGTSFGSLMWLSWVAFGSAIVLNVASYMSGFKDADREMQKIDECLRELKDYDDHWNPFRQLTGYLNISALVMFACGVILLASHAATATGADIDRQEIPVPQHREERRDEPSAGPAQPVPQP